MTYRRGTTILVLKVIIKDRPFLGKLAPLPTSARLVTTFNPKASESRNGI